MIALDVLKTVKEILMEDYGYDRPVNEGLIRWFIEDTITCGTHPDPVRLRNDVAWEIYAAELMLSLEGNFNTKRSIAYELWREADFATKLLHSLRGEGDCDAHGVRHLLATLDLAISYAEHPEEQNPTVCRIYP